MSVTVRIENALDLVAVAPNYGVEVKPAGAKPKRPLAEAIVKAGDTIVDTLYFHNGYAVKPAVAKAKAAEDTYRVTFQINVSETDVPVFEGVRVDLYTNSELRTAAGKSGSWAVSKSDVPAALAVLLKTSVDRVNVVSVENIGKPSATPVVVEQTATDETNEVPAVESTEESVASVETSTEPVAEVKAPVKRVRKPSVAKSAKESVNA